MAVYLQGGAYHVGKSLNVTSLTVNTMTTSGFRVPSTGQDRGAALVLAAVALRSSMEKLITRLRAISRPSVAYTTLENNLVEVHRTTIPSIIFFAAQAVSQRNMSCEGRILVKVESMRRVLDNFTAAKDTTYQDLVERIRGPVNIANILWMAWSLIWWMVYEQHLIRRINRHLEELRSLAGMLLFEAPVVEHEPGKIV